MEAIETNLASNEIVRILSRIRDKIVSIIEHHFDLSIKNRDFSLSTTSVRGEPFFEFVINKEISLIEVKKVLSEYFGNKVNITPYPANKKRLDIDVCDSLMEEYAKKKDDFENELPREVASRDGPILVDKSPADIVGKEHLDDEITRVNRENLPDKENQIAGNDKTIPAKVETPKNLANAIFLSLQVTLGVYDERLFKFSQSSITGCFDILVSEKLIPRVKDYLEGKGILYQYLQNGHFSINCSKGKSEVNKKSDDCEDIGTNNRSGESAISKNKKSTMLKNIQKKEEKNRKKPENMKSNELIKLCRKERKKVSGVLKGNGFTLEIKQGFRKQKGNYYVKEQVSTMVKNLAMRIKILNDNVEDFDKAYDIILEYYSRHKDSILVSVEKDVAEFTIIISYKKSFFIPEELSKNDSESNAHSASEEPIKGSSTALSPEILKVTGGSLEEFQKSLEIILKGVYFDQWAKKLKEENIVFFRITMGDDGKPNAVVIDIPMLKNYIY